MFNWFRKNNEENEILRAVNLSPRSRDGHLDSYSETWIFVSNWAEAELIRLREANDASALDAVQTAALRGRIKFAKELLNLPNRKERPQRKTNTEPA